MLSGKSPVFLVVDDSPTIRKMIISALRSLNPVFHEASSGLEALELLLLRPYDVVTLDLNMPDIHGLEFLRFVRSQHSFQDLPIVVITTQSEQQIRESVLLAGANSFLPKPFSPQEVLEEVRKLLAEA